MDHARQVDSSVEPGPPEVPWVESEYLDAYLANASASPGQVRAARNLARDGFAVLDLQQADIGGLCDAAIAELDRFRAEPAINRIQEAWIVSPAIRQLAGLDEVIAFLRFAYGREPFPFQTLNFERGSEQHAHADTMHFHCLPERFMCGAWLALEDVMPDAGPLVYYPGSHRLPVFSMRDIGADKGVPTDEDYRRLYPQAIARLIAERGLRKQTAILRKGQLLIWAANLLHGGIPIERDGATRRSLVTHYYFENCAYLTPRYSDQEKGRVFLRLPSDIRNGRWHWPVREGRLLWPGTRSLLGAVRRRLLPRPIAHRD